MGIDVPAFQGSFAIIPVVCIAMCASLFKPKSDYHPLKWLDYKKYLKVNRFVFWRDRFNLWTLRFVYYYSSAVTAGAIFLLDTALITVVAVVRYESGLHPKLHDVEDGAALCDAYGSSFERDIETNVASTLAWSAQLQWLLIIYFFTVSSSPRLLSAHLVFFLSFSFFVRFFLF